MIVADGGRVKSFADFQETGRPENSTKVTGAAESRGAAAKIVAKFGRLRSSGTPDQNNITWRTPSSRRQHQIVLVFCGNLPCIQQIVFTSSCYTLSHLVKPR